MNDPITGRWRSVVGARRAHAATSASCPTQESHSLVQGTRRFLVQRREPPTSLGCCLQYIQRTLERQSSIVLTLDGAAAYTCRRVHRVLVKGLRGGELALRLRGRPLQVDVEHDGEEHVEALDTEVPHGEAAFAWNWEDDLVASACSSTRSTATYHFACEPLPTDKGINHNSGTQTSRDPVALEGWSQERANGSVSEQEGAYAYTCTGKQRTFFGIDAGKMKSLTVSGICPPHPNRESSMNLIQLRAL